MASDMEFPLRIKRQYAEPLDSDTYAETKAELDDIKTRENSYVGMMVSCREDGLVYVLGTDMEFTPLGEGSVSIDLITKQDIEAMLNLTDEQLKTLSSLILDNEIRLDKTFSSSRIYSDIQQCLSDSKTYTLQELAKKTGASYKIATSVTDMTSTEYLYLLANANNAYDIYALIDGTAQKIGDTTIDLSQFYTKTEINNDFLKKTDADGKYITQTSFNSHTSDTDIHITTSERTKWNEVDNKVDKAIKDKKLKTYCISANEAFSDSKTLTDIHNNLPSNSIAVIDSGHDSSLFFGLPSNKFTIVWVRRYSGRDSVMAYTATGLSYICTNIKNQTWRRLCTTSVADVSETYITSYLDETYVKPTNTNTNSYSVTNGICEVRIEANCLATTNTLTKIVSGLPKAKNIKYANAVNRNQTLNTNATALFMIAGSDLYVTCNYGDTSVSGSRGFYVSFTYPVAES